MDFRVEELARQADVSVDTVRYYQAKGLLDPPRREGRVAWYDSRHLERLDRIRSLASRGLTLATISRLLTGDLDAADEALAAALSCDAGAPQPARSPAEPEGREGRAVEPNPTGQAGETLFTLDELAERTGIPIALLQAVSREGLLVPRRHDGQPWYTSEDVKMAAAGLAILEAGLPLPEILDLARRHHVAMREVAERAVTLFDHHVRQPLRSSVLPDEEAASRLVEAFHTLLPATLTLVNHHFRRTLLAVATEHIEQVGGPAEIDAVHHETEQGVRL